MSIGVGEQEATVAATQDEVAGRKVALSSVLHEARLFVLGLWLGAALFFSFAEAPAVFSVLRDSTALYPNHLAGTIVTRNLYVINTSGLVVSLLLLATAFVLRERLTRRALILEAGSLSVIAVATAVGQWVIAARMLELRARMMRPIDEVAAGDSLRVAFNSLHSYSVAALTAAMAAALVAFILMAQRRRSARAD